MSEDRPDAKGEVTGRDGGLIFGAVPSFAKDQRPTKA